MTTDKKYSKVIDIAHQAAKIILNYTANNKEIDSKSTEIDLVTIADKESEKLLFHFLRQNYPEDSILGEEGAEHQGSSGFTWIIDPLDGTVNFAHNFPFFAISIARVNKDYLPIFGLVYNPSMNEMFIAEKGKGAFLNKAPIQVSDVQRFQVALLATGFPYYRAKVLDRLIKRFANCLKHAGGIRRTGSAALDLCYVACGRFDVYFEEGLNPWDMAAAILIVQEAQGKVAKFDLSPVDIKVPEVLAANSYLIEDLAKVVQGESL